MADRREILIVIKALDWDDPNDPRGNVKHIARHDVTPQEVEEVLQSAPVFHRVEAEGQNAYFEVIGPTAAGRLLEIWGIYYQSGPKGTMWRTSTALDARKDAQKLWNKERGGRR